ncbi:MAG: hypothetical protein AAFO57_02265 [Pseudomonadota bacterium]
MKISLDIDALIADGTVPRELGEVLRARGKPAAGGTVAISVLLIFGAIAVAGGVLAYDPSATVGLLLAATALGAGFTVQNMLGAPWRLLAHGLAIMGGLGLAGWVGAEFHDHESAFWPPVAITLIFGAIAAAFRNTFLAVMATLSLGAVIGSGTGYWHASYMLVVRESFITIALFGALAAGAYALRDRIRDAWQGLSTAVARTAVIMVNFGFWVGSLWGDHIGEHWYAGDSWQAAADWRESALYLPEAVFSIGWAAALFALILKAPRGGFLSVSSIVFLGIHFYTQIFETLGAEPFTMILGGVLAVAIAVYLSRRAFLTSGASAA